MDKRKPGMEDQNNSINLNSADTWEKVTRNEKKSYTLPKSTESSQKLTIYKSIKTSMNRSTFTVTFTEQCLAVKEKKSSKNSPVSKSKPSLKKAQ